MYENALLFVQTFLWPVYGLSAPINRLTSGDRLMQENGKMRIPANYLANMLSNMCQLVLLCQCLCFNSVNLTPLRGLSRLKVLFLEWEADSCASYYVFLRIFFFKTLLTSKRLHKMINVKILITQLKVLLQSELVLSLRSKSENFFSCSQ